MNIHTTQATLISGLPSLFFETLVSFIQTKKPDTESVLSSTTSTELSSFKTESCYYHVKEKNSKWIL